MHANPTKYAKTFSHEIRFVFLETFLCFSTFVTLQYFADAFLVRTNPMQVNFLVSLRKY